MQRVGRLWMLGGRALLSKRSSLSLQWCTRGFSQGRAWVLHDVDLRQFKARVDKAALEHRGEAEVDLDWRGTDAEAPNRLEVSVTRGGTSVIRFDIEPSNGNGVEVRESGRELAFMHSFAEEEITNQLERFFDSLRKG